MKFWGCCANLGSSEPLPHSLSLSLIPSPSLPLRESGEFSECGVNGCAEPQPCHRQILNVPGSSVIKWMKGGYSRVAQTPSYFPYKCRITITPSTALRPAARISWCLPCPTDISSLAGIKIHRESGATAGGMTRILGQECPQSLIFSSHIKPSATHMCVHVIGKGMRWERGDESCPSISQQFLNINPSFWE